MSEITKVIENGRESMEKTISSLKKNFASLRSGRVNSSNVENIMVNYYEVLTPLSQVASIIVQDASTILINPWDKHALKDIERAIQEANIGVNPNNDGESIRLNFPPMTKEQRMQIAKNAKQIAEKDKIAIRNIRQDANNALKKMEKAKEITEDDSKKAQDNVQKLTDEFIKKIDDALKTKEEEILKV